MGRKGRAMLRAAMRVLPEEKAGLVVKGIDIVGDIAVIKIPEELKPNRLAIAEALLREIPSVKVVLRKVAPVGGTHRTIGIEWLAGDKRTVTVHKEYGCLYRLDLSEVYFSPRLATERKRIADQVRKTTVQETIVNMFSGIGSFSIMIAKHAKPAKVYSIDISPVATRYARENVALNKVEGVVDVVLGDARQVIKERLLGAADRVLMQLPGSAYEFLDAATLALKPKGGIIHYYCFVREGELGAARRDVLECLKALGYEGRITLERKVSEVSPRRHEVVFDVNVSPLQAPFA
ncbi:MAG: class I SAM-dependent methyltransferase family protein [Candidatus Bathyarchaeia archaeon]